MGFQSLFLAFLCFITAVHAGQLTVQLPRLTVFGSDGDQLRSEAYATPSIFLLFALKKKRTTQNIPYKTRLPRHLGSE